MTSNPEIRKAYEAENERDYIAQATFGSIVSIPLQLSCLVMDWFMYGDRPGLFMDFVKIRIAVALLTLLVFTWFRSRPQSCPRRLFGITWFGGPLLMVLWMMYYVGDPINPYYAGLNIILLAMGLISPWTYGQNTLITVFTVVMYIVLAVLSHPKLEAIRYVINNTTFLFLTAAFVILGSRANARQRLAEFTLRYELDKNRKSLEQTNHKLIELDKLKSRFFANVSHELRTPLTLLLGPLEVLIQKFSQSVDTSSQEMLQTMHANGMRLLKLINDLLELIRLEAGRLEIKTEPLPVLDFMNGIASSVRQMAREKNITFETQSAPELGTILADRDKLEKIVLNLLFNALKFTPAGGRVWFRAEQKDGHFVIVVGDTGKGIEEKSLPFVFDRFWQEDGSSKRKFQGVGIGLALVKELTEMMGGLVSVQSQLGKGATFTVRLPFKPAGAAAAETPAPAAGADPTHTEEWLTNLYRRAELFPAATVPRPPSPGTPSTTTFARRTQRPLVLVADDEPDMRRFLVSQLMEDYEVIEAADGLEATDRAQEALPDVILLDLMMPQKDGLQVCRELREYAPTSGIPIILLTARADEEVKFDALQMGANDFLAKPFSSTELQARIKNLIESHHYQRRLTKQNQALNDAIEQIKETEMQLVQSEKLSSLGRMSAGIIHEINNPLNFSMTGLFALRNKGKKLPEADRPDYEAIINDVEEGLKRVRNIVSDLRTFTHPGGGTGEPVEAGDAADAAVRFLGGEWKDTVEIHQDIPHAQLLWANRNKLIHILVNLMQNAIDALRDKQFFAGEKPAIWLEGRIEGDRSLIIVRDNGPGIEPKIMDKIFDPFFTTKEVGKGMGLGLSICYRIVQGYGGKISVKSEPGKSCQFTLDFPLDADAVHDLEIDNGQSVRL
ncbi:MAG TPA: ATP-binding protein [Candidatus Acidoferrales bacterium]|jgi:signal transduction histidine kinase|nr:ATP-binding protein [Candidatus Acidoferrales bacterium]